MSPRVFVSRSLFPEALDKLAQVADVDVWTDELPPPYDVLRERVQRADGLLSLLTDHVDRALFDDAPGLRVVSNMAVGYNNIDVTSATAHGVFVGNTPGVLTETTADFTVALMMAWARRIPEAQGFAREGHWKTWGPMLMLGTELHEATLGIVGLGRIGTAVARRARGFGMRVLYTSRTRNRELESELSVEYHPELLDLLACSDFVSLHVSLDTGTRHLIGSKELAAMGAHGVLVNTSRGEVVDQQALYKALQIGLIAGAALDVTDPEPLPAHDPLYKLENVLITPHIASATTTTRLKMATMAAQNIVDVLQGRPPGNWVNPEMQNGGG